MISRLFNFWQILKSNLWFVPAFVSVLYMIFTMGLYQFESSYFQDTTLPSVFFNGSAEDAKSLAITLLSSMITMATLAISITMIVLSLAASQLGPRLIRTFMSDRKTKMFISLFFGAVISCFILTMILHDATPKDYTPKLTISTVFMICFLNLFVLLAFVHHVARSSIADEIIIKVTNDLYSSLERLTTSQEESENPEPDASDWPKDFDAKRQRLYFERSGYVQNINYDEILDIAQEHGLFVQIHFKAGHFLVEGEDGVNVYPKNKLNEDLDNDIRNCFIIGNTRTATQDIEYSIRHLVEIGIRALSPGINDSFTAITVLDRLSAAMAILFQKETPLEWLADSENRVRVCAKQSDEADIIFSAFDQIRCSGQGNPTVLRHIVSKFKILCELADSEAQIEGLHKQLDKIQHDMKNINEKSSDVQDALSLCAELKKY